MELKTLKDLNDPDDKDGCCTIAAPYEAEDPHKIANYKGDEWKQDETLKVNVQELRAEAIKWINFLEEDIVRLKRLDGSWTYKRVQVDWIKHFFNIGDEELKGS